MGAAGDEIKARIDAAHRGYENVWADFLRNRWSHAETRAAVLLQLLAAVPEGQKDAELWAAEADFCYIAGAVRGNDPGTLERALACYARCLSLPAGKGNANARRMYSETLLRLRRYEEAFAAFGELAARRPTPFGELEVAPFRLRHDAALAERLGRRGRLAPPAAAQAAAALRETAARVEARFAAAAAAAKTAAGVRWRWPRAAELPEEDARALRRGLFGELAHASAPYPPERLLAWVGADPLSAGVDWALAERDYGSQDIAVVDCFLNPAALEELWTYSREAVCFSTVRNGFLGAFPADGNVHPLLLAAAGALERRMPGALAGHPLGLWWLFKYTEAGTAGIGIHADAAAVNVNIWLTPDDARRTGGGLDIYRKLPPEDADVVEINREFATEADESRFRAALLAEGGVHQVEYKQNRAVIFCSDLYHASQPFDFVDCTEQPRVNLTFLFGDRPARSQPRPRPPEQRGAGTAGAGGFASGTGASPLDQEEGWDLFE